MAFFSVLSRRPWLGWLLVLALFGGGLGLGTLLGAWTVICRDGRCPSIASLEAYVPRQTSKVYAADGRLVVAMDGASRDERVLLTRDTVFLYADGQIASIASLSPGLRVQLRCEQLPSGAMVARELILPR